MIYTCKDCSYSGNQTSQDGSCLACGSHNLERKGAKQAPAKSGKWRVSILVALWAYLIGLIIWKLDF